MSRTDQRSSPQTARQDSFSPSPNSNVNVMATQRGHLPLLTAAAHSSMLPAFSPHSTPRGSPPECSPSSSSVHSPLSLQGASSHPISGDLPSNAVSSIQSPSLGFEISAHEIESSSSASTSGILSPTSSSSVTTDPPTTTYLFDPRNLLLPTMAKLDEEEEEEVEKEEEQVLVPQCQWEGCGMQCHSLQQLVSHLDHDHTTAVASYVCRWAGCPRQQKPFDARYKLVTHLRCHTGERPYKCTHVSCKRTFSRLENLKLHMRTHTGEKPYSCHHNGCEKRFNNTSDRAKHMKTHVTRKPYVCKHPGCDKAYTDPSSMRKHIKFSHRAKPRHASYSAPSPEQIIQASTSAYPNLVRSAPTTPLHLKQEHEGAASVYQLASTINQFPGLPSTQVATLQGMPSPTSILYMKNGIQFPSPIVQTQSQPGSPPLVVMMPVKREVEPSNSEVAVSQSRTPSTPISGISSISLGSSPTLATLTTKNQAENKSSQLERKSTEHSTPEPVDTAQVTNLNLAINLSSLIPTQTAPGLVPLIQPAQQRLLVIPQLPERSQTTALQQPISQQAPAINCIVQSQPQVVPLVPLTSLTQSYQNMLLLQQSTSCSQTMLSADPCKTLQAGVTGQVQPIRLLPVIPTSSANSLFSLSSS